MTDEVSPRPERSAPPAGDGRPLPEPVRRGTAASVAVVRRLGHQPRH